jgi:predicted metalloprotease with PDZ domain
MREGSEWRPLSDTTRDPIIAARCPLPWPSWQRSEDYYTEGSLIWLDVDTRLRELSGDGRSLDDFARAFFGREDRVWITCTYTFEDVVRELDKLAAFDWAEFFDRKLNRTTVGAPLAGIERGGYRLVYRDTQSEYQQNLDALSGKTNLLFSVGLMVGSGGKISEVRWGSPAFDAALVAGTEIVGVNGCEFTTGELKRAIAEAAEGSPIVLLVKQGKSAREVEVAYDGGHRYPHLEPIDGGRRRLDDILAPLP